ncbi:endonuclease III [Taylorella equigenitalis]|uniref:endonuclease III n=1 Tax=Taylorella equigenitalis TaxID=29575 RepID=UPI0004141FC7|nr:endonuclease III [Taylorella equigenitalis]WDU46817.1 endonuclease III [Taylorella equigenitalis]
MNKQKREIIFERFYKQNPQPQSELNYSNNFQLLVSVILSAQATDKSVNFATTKLWDHIFTPQQLIDYGFEKFEKQIKTVGLYKTKAKNVFRTCEDLILRFDGEVPSTREELESLAGVGRKTANVILNVAFGLPTMAVDTHIFRVANRTGISKGKNVLEVEKGLIKNVPKKYAKDSHHWMILHGRYICQARKPKCASCIIEDLCEYKFKQYT